MTSVSMGVATVTDRQRAISTLVMAFSTDPVLRWVYPDSHQYLTYFPELVRLFGGRAFEHGTAHCVADSAGAALWLPPGVQPDEEALGALLQTSVYEQAQEHVFAMLGQMDTYHPKESHWYLPVIGVDPTQQGRGYGSALLKHALAECDRENNVAYLESSNPRNVLLYERHGFQVIGEIQVADSPPLWPMLRSAR